MAFPVRPLTFRAAAPRARAAAVSALGPRPLPPALQLERLRGRVSGPLAQLLWGREAARGGLLSGRSFADLARRPAFTVAPARRSGADDEEMYAEVAADMMWADEGLLLEELAALRGPEDAAIVGARARRDGSGLYQAVEDALGSRAATRFQEHLDRWVLPRYVELAEADNPFKDWSEFQRVADLPEYFELGVRRPGLALGPPSPLSERLSAVRRKWQRSDAGALRKNLWGGSDEHWSDPELLAHARGSYEPGGDAALEELQSDMLESWRRNPKAPPLPPELARSPHALGAFGALRWLAGRPEPPRRVLVPTAATVGSVRPPSARSFLEGVYDRELPRDFLAPLGRWLGREPYGAAPDLGLGRAGWTGGAFRALDLGDADWERVRGGDLPHWRAGGPA